MKDSKNMRTALVTGSAGFIGYHVSKMLLENGWDVYGIDSLTEYYDVKLKQDRELLLSCYTNFEIIREDISKQNVLKKLFAQYQPNIVIHLAAQAGVRYSIENPRSYLETNINGTFELLEACRYYPPEHTLIASTSSAYGSNTVMPFHENMKADTQMSFYAATKKSTENIAHSYSHLFKLPITMFRFFTVYGPWGRPDMALFKFTDAILKGNPIDIYNNGNMKRDFTYIEDLSNAIKLLIGAAPALTEDPVCNTDSVSDVAPFRVVNIGNSKSVELLSFISALEASLGITAIKNYMPMQAGDVPETLADISLLKKLTDYEPTTSVEDGINAFVKWYLEYYNTQSDC